MPRVRQHRTSKALAIQQRSKQKHINNFEKETVLDDLHREGIYMNVHNIHTGHTRYLWKDNTTLWKFTYKKLCDRYVNHYVNYSSYATTYDCSNIRCNYGIIVGFTHPDGLMTNSYYNGYNGTDLLECVEITRKGLRRKRNSDGGLKRFTTTKDNCNICGVDLWHRTGPKLIVN